MKGYQTHGPPGMKRGGPKRACKIAALEGSTIPIPWGFLPPTFGRRTTRLRRPLFGPFQWARLAAAPDPTAGLVSASAAHASV